MSDQPLSAEEWIKRYEDSIQNIDESIPALTKVAIGLPMLFPYIHVKFFNSFMMLQKPEGHITISHPGSLTAIARNNIVEIALKKGCSHIMFLDTDMTFPPDIMPRLMSHDKDIVGGLYFERYYPYRPACFWKDEDGDYVLPNDIPQNQLVRVNAIGTGAMLIKTTVFEKLSQPYFDYRLTNYGSAQKVKFFSEDIVFCGSAEKAGVEIFCDTSVKCGHLLNDVEVTEDHWDKSYEG